MPCLVVTTQIFYSQKTPHSLPVRYPHGQAMGCILWVQSRIYLTPLTLLFCIISDINQGWRPLKSLYKKCTTQSYSICNNPWTLWTTHEWDTINGLMSNGCQFTGLRIYTYTKTCHKSTQRWQVFSIMTRNIHSHLILVYDLWMKKHVYQKLPIRNWDMVMG